MPTRADVKKMPFSPIDLHFAEFLAKEEGGGNGETDSILFAAAAMAVCAVGFGHSCCDLRAFEGRPFSAFFREISSGAAPEFPGDAADPAVPSVAEIRKAMRPPRAAALPGDSPVNIPLILDREGRLYLNRNYFYESALAEGILRLCRAEGNRIEPDADAFNRAVSFFEKTTGLPETDHQKLAAFTALRSAFTVITGGPGTGKTTVVAAMLSLALRERPDARIVLCAPTGKAAGRLCDSIRSNLPFLNCPESVRENLERSAAPENAGVSNGTIHSILGPVRGSPFFRRNAENPLPADLVLADEASMIPLHLMAKLVDALKPEAELILLGDKDQLASVEAGAVLGDICASGLFNTLAPADAELFRNITGWTVPPPGDGRPLSGHIAELTVSRRFATAPGISRVSASIRNGDAPEETLRLIRNPGSEDFRLRELPENPAGGLREFFGATPRELRRLLREPDRSVMKNGFDLFNDRKILCAVRAGKFGTVALNRLSRAIFGMDDSDCPPGLPVLILKNDRSTGLYNGDTGIAWPDPVSGRIKVFFPPFPETGVAEKSFFPYELPPHEDVFAMTVHKSQGSGFRNVLAVFPGQDAPILTKELFYTAVTRAEANAGVWCPGDLLERMLSRRVFRHSGLREKLLGEEGADSAS